MTTQTTQDAIEGALATLAEMNPQATDGEWLEFLTTDVSPYVKEWDIEAAYMWADWPERQVRYPNTTKRDVGIDVVGIRRSDGEHIAIQCKSRKLDEQGRGDSIKPGETDRCITTSNDAFWAERWLVTNGDNRPTSPLLEVLSMQGAKPLKIVNIHKDLLEERDSVYTSEDCSHCQPHEGDKPPLQTKTCMQNEAVANSVCLLREHVRADTGGLPVGQARGKIILPCGTGKTRISLRIVEELAQSGELAVILCPSIALVAQIRREYLQHAQVSIRALAVCSDQTAGYNPKRDGVVDTFANPTADNGNVSASEVKGKVTTDSREIADWIIAGRDAETISVVFGTYQSGRRVADALNLSGTTAKVLVADEAHRTAGLRRKSARARNAAEYEAGIRDFTLCHDNNEFPATYRIYQTATPKVFGLKNNVSDDWIVRTMDDETVFGVELYRKSYPEAVDNGWLADYRIIALAVNDPEAYNQANLLASGTELKGRKAITSSQYLRGLAFALAMGGATQGGEKGDVPINSCIAFLNSVDKSKEMATKLQSEPVREWVQEWLHNNGNGSAVRDYTLEHLDASSNVTARDAAKQKLADADERSPYGILNVGIFGEGTDSPSLNAVAFLEARKSPIDVIQAVGRAMRTSADKKLGYIICPILIPADNDPESWLSVSNTAEGWQELGQILLALRAHDQRIEDNLEGLLWFYLPPEPEVVSSIVAVARQDSGRISYWRHEGPPGSAQEALERVAAEKSKPSEEFRRISESEGEDETLEPSIIVTVKALPQKEEAPVPEEVSQPSSSEDIEDNFELRMDTVPRDKPAADGTPGKADIGKAKTKAKKMINENEGVRLRPSSKKRRNRRSRDEVMRESGQQMIMLSGLDEHGDAIKMNLLSKSGLSADRVIRDLNVLEASISEAAFHLRSEGLTEALNRHFNLDLLNPDGKKTADGCTIAALLLMNAAMLHQRISAGRWMPEINNLSNVKNSVRVVRQITRDWNDITRHDFLPVFDPAIKAIYAIENEGKIAGLERALRHITAEAERIAETYADMGADHAGPLFNRVIGNQASDGAFFTRPVAASIAARLTLDACGEQDWTNPDVWRQHKTVDLACGSGTLLAAILANMKDRAKKQGADDEVLGQLQRVAVEDGLKGMDINPVSLQLAAAQLTAGNRDVRYRRMGLYEMSYGPDPNYPGRIFVGTLELLGQRAIVQRNDELDIPDDAVGAQSVWGAGDDAKLEDAVDAAKDARIVIMNPPFSNRIKMGEKFPKGIQQRLRTQVDAMEQNLVRNDRDMGDFVDKNALEPLFTALADRCLNRQEGVMTMVTPTVALCATSAQNKRRILAQRFHIHTVVTSHQPQSINLSQHTSINESIVVMRRHAGPKPPTRFINLDKMPVSDGEVADFHRCLLACEEGSVSNGWGEVSYWPAKHIEAGDWTPAIWRSSTLADASTFYANHVNLYTIADITKRSIPFTGRDLFRGRFERIDKSTPGSFGVLDSKAEDAQVTIQSKPDRYWIPINRDEEMLRLNGGTYPEADKLLKKAGHLLVTAGQDNSTARVTATASDNEYVGNGWMPVTGLSPEAAKAMAVFINSTVGRLQLMRNQGLKITFPTYRPAGIEKIKVPDTQDDCIRGILSACWERTKDMKVSQFRDGECDVRRLWDEAVAEAMGWDASELTRLRLLLHQEPHVRGLGYGQYADEVE